MDPFFKKFKSDSGGLRDTQGYSLIEVMMATGLLGVLIVILSSSFTMSGKSVDKNEARINFELLTSRIYNVFKDNAICETTNLVTDAISIKTAGFTQQPIKSFGELTVAGQVVAEKGFDKSRGIHIKKLELWQQTPPFVPAISPQRFFGKFRIAIKADADRNSLRLIKRDIPVMLVADAAGIITSCYTEVSRRIPCEDMGWTYDPSATPECQKP